jgi:hypothetical protein
MNWGLGRSPLSLLPNPVVCAAPPPLPPTATGTSLGQFRSAEPEDFSSDRNSAFRKSSPLPRLAGSRAISPANLFCRCGTEASAACCASLSLGPTSRRAVGCSPPTHFGE